jgi:hypothetical protein
MNQKVSFIEIAQEINGREPILSKICITANVIAQEINGREPILSKICITANVQENVILHYKTFYFGKTCPET